MLKSFRVRFVDHPLRNARGQRVVSQLDYASGEFLIDRSYPPRVKDQAIAAARDAVATVQIALGLNQLRLDAAASAGDRSAAAERPAAG